MSTEQSESKNSQGENPQQSCNPQVDITQQATTPTPTSTPQRAKNPKRVAAGKAVAEKTRLAREQQKKAAAEAAIIIANNKAKPLPRFLSQHRLLQTKAQRVPKISTKLIIEVSASHNGLLLAA